MAAKGLTFDNDLLKLIFNATAISLLADNTATTPLTSLFLSLHTANPGVGGSQTTSEAAYTGYARATVARSAGGFTVAGAVVTLTAAVSFPAATAGSETEAWFAVGTAVSGVGKILYTGAISPSIIVSAGVTPQLTAASSITES